MVLDDLWTVSDLAYHLGVQKGVRRLFLGFVSLKPCLLAISDFIPPEERVESYV